MRYSSITSDSDRFEKFINSFYSRNTEIFEHAVELSERGLYCEVFMWCAILIEAHLSLFLAVYEEMIFEIGEIQDLPLKNYVPDGIEVFRKYTLGGLIGKFAKISGKPLLNSRLENFNQNRNKVVHKFIDSGFSLKNSVKFKKNSGEAFALVYELQEEFNSLLREAAKIKGARIGKLKAKLKETTKKVEDIKRQL